VATKGVLDGHPALHKSRYFRRVSDVSRRERCCWVDHAKAKLRRRFSTHLRPPPSLLAVSIMIRGLHAPIRSFTRFNRLKHSSTKTPDALNILFCGSDEFSIASLRALHKAKREDHSNIRSIEVVHRPGKRTGRGLKVIREGMCRPRLH
jgi:hypothetical protein